MFKQFYLGCLAHASYLIVSNDEAAVVDPQRDVEQYLEEAARQNARIRYVIETHVHADFVSGHRELAARTGAEIVFGARANVDFPHRGMQDGGELQIGSMMLRCLETPGHTPESVCWLVTDTAVSDSVQKVLTGDTLFIGDVGRPDLVGSLGFTAADMAGMMYDSLHQKVLTLDDAVEVYPAHGAGSACGRNISKETSSTIGQQRRLNYALQPMSRDTFVTMMTTDLPQAPRYFSMDAELNRKGPKALSELQVLPLSVAAVDELRRHGAVVLDVRDSQAFGVAHLPGSVNIALQGQYASWSGSLLDPSTPVIIVSSGTPEAAEAVLRLARVGLENVAGFLDGGVEAWNDAGMTLESISQISVTELAGLLDGATRPQVVDVRSPLEYQSGHVPSAVNLSLPRLEQELGKLDPSRLTAVICAGGYRSSAGASLLKRHGFQELANVLGGTAAWVNAGHSIEREPESKLAS